MLTTIGDSNELAAITGILPFALSAQGDIAKAAAAAVHKLTRGITSRELAWLDSAVRKLSPYWGSDFYAWDKMSPDQLGLLERFGETSVNRTFNLPSSAQIARVKTTLAECGDLLDEETREQILFSIKTS